MEIKASARLGGKAAVLASDKETAKNAATVARAAFLKAGSGKATPIDMEDGTIGFELTGVAELQPQALAALAVVAKKAGNLFIEADATGKMCVYFKVDQ